MATVIDYLINGVEQIDRRVKANEDRASGLSEQVGCIKAENRELRQEREELLDAIQKLSCPTVAAADLDHTAVVRPCTECAADAGHNR